MSDEVYLLEAELEDGNDYDGLSAVHATCEGAIRKFEKWLADAGIPTDVAYQGSVWTDTFIGNDYVCGDTQLHWGINRMRVGE